MINTVIIILLINLFAQYITKSPITTLNCGIWGFSGKNNNNFTWNKFNILGIMNDSRGGDATGRSVGKFVEHFNNNDNKKYVDLLANVLNPRYKDETVMFGHTRKTSYSAVAATSGIEYTQPYPIRNSEGDLIAVGMHNGTLYNKEELMEEYNIPKKITYLNEEDEIVECVPNDSQVLLYALAIKRDYSILQDYEGSAALAWYNFEREELYLFRGESKYSSAAIIDSTERPLYLMQEKYNVWFSSEKKPLWIISQRKEPDISELKANTVITIKDGRIVSEQEITRKKGQFHHYVSRRNDYSYWEEERRRNNQRSSLPSPATVVKTKGIESEGFPYSSDSVLYARGRYWYDKDTKMNGIYHIDSTGKISNKAIRIGGVYMVTKPYYFIEGVMINGHDDFRTKNQMLKGIGYNYRESWIRNSISRVAVHPVHEYGKDKTMSYYDAFDDRVKFYTGKIEPLFHNKTYDYHWGELVSTNNSVFKFADHKDVIQSIKDEDANINTNAAVKLTGEEEYEMTPEQIDEYQAVMGSESMMEKLPFDDGFDDDQDDLAKNEVLHEVAIALSAVSTCRSNLSIYSDGKFGKKVIELIDQVEDLFVEIGAND